MQLLRGRAVIEGQALFKGQDLFALEASGTQFGANHLPGIIEEGMRALRPELGSAERRSAIEGLIEKVGLRRESLRRFTHEFSGGQRQRIAMARALAV